MPVDKKLPNTPKITLLTTKTMDHRNSVKRTSSAISPIEQETTMKKPNIDFTMANSEPMLPRSVVPQPDFHDLIEPIMCEFKSLKDTMATQEGKISEELSQLKTVIKKQKEEIVSEINVTVDTNSRNIVKVLEENKELRRENNELKDHMSKIELAQLRNNVIVTGILEQPFEMYKKLNSKFMISSVRPSKHQTPPSQIQQWKKLPN